MNTIKPQIASAKTSDLVFLSQSNELVTDSRWVSLYFGKPHKDVLAKIKSLSCSEQFRYANFSAPPLQTRTKWANIRSLPNDERRLYVSGDGLYRQAGRRNQRALYQRLQRNGREPQTTLTPS